MEKLKFLELNKKETLDTSMAQIFINKNNTSDWPVNGQLIFEKMPNETPKYLTIQELVNTLDSYKTPLPAQANFAELLASEIVNNSRMLVQLEYLVRKTDARDVTDGHIPLMCQLLTCDSSLWNNFKFRFLHFTETTPLYNLAVMAGGLHSDYPQASVILVENKSVKPLCQFFVQLCRNVGLEIAIVYMNPGDIELLRYSLTLKEGVELFDDFFVSEATDNTGCTGVIAERSDLDSAIDVFINSSITAPWRLKQIYVQESIFGSFKSALSAKSHNTGNNHTIGNKTFLVECLLDQVGIPTHAYRTTKELLSLIKTPYLSIWAAELALSHEIALLSPSNTVWINDYASFEGPHRSCLSVYNKSSTIQLEIPSYLNKDLEYWTKLSVTERRNIIKSAIEISRCELADKHLADLANCSSDDVLQVTEKSICFGIVQKKLDIVRVECCSPKRALQLLLNGNMVLGINGYIVEDILMSCLKRQRVPIQISSSFGDYCFRQETVPVSTPLLLERLKVVRMNYGTIYAN